MRIVHRGLLLAALVAAPLAACSGGHDSTGPSRTTCTTDVELSVSSGTTPTFTWTPACGVGAVSVMNDSAEVWYLEATTRAGIASGLRYGAVPTGAIQDAPAEPLVAGRTYRVFVAKAVNDSLVLAGLKSFSP